MMMAEKTAGNGSEKTTLNLSVTVEDKKFLKTCAPEYRSYGAAGHIIQISVG